MRDTRGRGASRSDEREARLGETDPGQASAGVSFETALDSRGGIERSLVLALLLVPAYSTDPSGKVPPFAGLGNHRRAITTTTLQSQAFGSSPRRSLFANLPAAP